MIEDVDQVRVLVMNRPTKLNALNTALTTELRDALEAAESDRDVNVIVLAGEGRAFCSGADTTEFHELSPANQEAVVERAELTMQLHRQLQTMTKPTVSAVQGVAVGGGAGLAIACDMMIAATNLRFGYPEIRHALVPAIVMTGLQRHLGRKLAFEMIATGRLLDASEARTAGLTNRIVKPDEVRGVAKGLAAALAAQDSRALAATKELFYRVSDLSVEAAMLAGRDANSIMRSFRPIALR